MTTLLIPDTPRAHELARLVTTESATRRARAIADETGLLAALDADADLVLWTTDGVPPPQTVLTVAATRHVPVIIVAPPGVDPASLLRAGADAVLRADQPEVIAIVVGRRLCERRHLRLLGERYRALLARSQDAIALLHRGRHRFVNPAYLALTGHDDADALLGHPFSELVDDTWPAEDVLDALAQGKPVNGDELLIAGAAGALAVRLFAIEPGIDGESTLEITLHPHDDAPGAEHLVRYLSLHDRVTGLYNSRYLNERIEEAAQSVRHGTEPAALALLTLDNFDDIRAQVGLTGAERILSDLGRLLGEAAGPDGVAARVKGACFGVLAPDVGEPQRLATFLHALRERIQDHVFATGGHLVTARVTIGAAAIAADGADGGELLARAELAHSEAATTGDDTRTATYRPSGGATLRDTDANWEKRLVQAIDDNRLRLLFQPVVSLNCPPRERYGVLMRVLDDDGTPINPSQFLPSAERTGLSRTLDRWVVDHALEQLAWLRDRQHDTVFFIKLTDGSLQDEEMPRWIESRLQRRGIPPSAVAFEMKEATVAARLTEAQRLVEALERLGCAFVLDDFGLGQEPFQIVEHLPVAYLKFDPVFTRHLADRPGDRETMSRLVRTAHEMGRQSIAQHVENAVSLSVLWGLGIHLIQGYFLQRPSEAMEFDFRSLA